MAEWMGKEEEPFEGSLIIDIPEIKIVEANFNNRLFLLAIGTLPRRKTVVSGEGSDAATEDKRGTDETDLEWKIFYDSTALLDIMPIEKAKDFMAGTVAVSSGSASVHDSGTIYIASGSRPSKGNAPLLLDYEMAKKIEEAKKKK